MRVSHVMLPNALYKCRVGLDFGRMPGHKTFLFPCQVAAAGDEGYLVCAAVAAAAVPSAVGSPSVFCKEWLFMPA